MRNEAGWFMKVAWNLALQCGESHREMAELFFACYKVYTCSPVPRPHPQRRKGSQTTPPKEERVPDQTPKRGTSSSSSLLPPALSPPGDRPGCAGEEEDVPADVCRCSSPRSQRHFQQPGQGERNTCLPLSLSPSPPLSLSPSLPLSLSPSLTLPPILIFHILQISILEKVLSHVSECRSICQQIGTRTNDPDDPTHSILCMYEFEAKHWLGRSDAETVLEHLTSQPSPEPKTFEIIAG